MNEDYEDNKVYKLLEEIAKLEKNGIAIEFGNSDSIRYIRLGEKVIELSIDDLLSYHKLMQEELEDGKRRVTHMEEEIKLAIRKLEKLV